MKNDWKLNSPYDEVNLSFEIDEIIDLLFFGPVYASLLLIWISNSPLK